MTGRRLTALTIVFFALFGVSAVATDAPHHTNVTISVECDTSCHVPHAAAGGALTQSASNVNLCQSCHNATGVASDMPINNSDKAVPGTSGTSHSFDAPAVNATYDTVSPSNAEMSKRIYNNNIVCSTCHDQHAAVSSKGGTPHISAAKQITALGSTGTVTSGGTYSGGNGAWYLVEIYGVGGATGTAKFHYSKDNGTTWFPATPGSTLTAASVALDSGVTVSFGVGNFNVGERWQFYGSWPFIRATLDSGNNTTGAKFCRDCHAGWTMGYTQVNTYDGTYKSHPVGVALNADGGGYDRATPLDGNGVPQAGADRDGNPSNNLKLDASGDVQCLTCHGVHFADSNTLTVDGP